MFTLYGRRTDVYPLADYFQRESAMRRKTSLGLIESRTNCNNW